jgi:hypothetical protein
MTGSLLVQRSSRGWFLEAAARRRDVSGSGTKFVAVTYTVMTALGVGRPLGLWFTVAQEPASSAGRAPFDAHPVLRRGRRLQARPRLAGDASWSGGGVW